MNKIVSSQKLAGNAEGAKRPTAGDECSRPRPREFTSRGEGGRVPPFIEKLVSSQKLGGNRKALEGAKRLTAGDECSRPRPREFTSRGEGGRVPPFIEKLQKLHKVAVLDFGGQYTHLIANRIRNLGVLSEIHLPEEFDPSKENGLAGIILSGGPHSVAESAHPTIRFELKDSPCPILGLCYGHQLLAKLLGGTVTKGSNREFGPAKISIGPDTILFKGLPSEQTVWMSHGDHVSVLPEFLKSTATSPDLSVGAFESDDGKFFGLQFHPEVSHTLHGRKILDLFLTHCHALRDWTPEVFCQSIIESIAKTSQGKKLFLLLSGGVDSLVTLAACIKAVGPDRVFSLHIDTGLMREKESEEIMDFVDKLGFSNIKLCHAEDMFLERLAEVHDPEQKRKIIGEAFVEIAQRETGDLENDDNWLLVQGTIYPDRIESGSGKKSARIKTHHNRVEGIRRLIDRNRVLEPIKDLYKDEVRLLGKQLGLPDNLINRHPFPGPGLGVRILASATDEPEPEYDREEGLMQNLIKGKGLNWKILPVRSVGVQGDGRTYLHPVVVWPSSKRIPSWDTLQECALTIINRLQTVNRVVFSLSPASEIFLQRAFVDKSRAERLRKVDSLVRKLTEHIAEIWQMPVVSLPACNPKGEGVFVLRPVVSENAMTADFYRFYFSELREIESKLLALEGVGNVFLDITSKPPGTIEWE